MIREREREKMEGEINNMHSCCNVTQIINAVLYEAVTPYFARFSEDKKNNSGPSYDYDPSHHAYPSQVQATTYILLIIVAKKNSLQNAA